MGLKYEVDEGYWKIECNNNLTADQKQNKINELNSNGKQLKVSTYTYTFVTFATFVTATGLLIKRNKVLGE